MGLVTQRLHITPNAFGVLDGRAPSGIPIAPVMAWAPVPDYLQKLQGTPFSVDISVYLTSSSGDAIQYSLLSGTWPSGWSISDSGTVSYDGSAIGAATVTIRATQDGTTADTNAFTVESIAVAPTDALAPTIPVGITLTSKSSTTASVTCDAPADVSADDGTPYTGMKEVRWFKDGVLDGVSATAAGLSLRLTKADIAGAGATSTARKFRGGHYTVLGDGDVWSGVPYHGGTYTGIPNSTHLWDTGPLTTDSAGIVIRRRFGALMTAANTFDFSSITSALAQLATLSLTQDPTGVKKLLLYVLIEMRTFTGSDTWDNPMPAHLISIADGGTGAKTYAEIFGPSGPQLKTGWQGWRWAPTVKSALQATCAAMGAFPVPGTAYTIDSHPNFGGLGTQETATGASAGGTGAGEAYTVANFVQALKDESDYISAGCPTSRHLFYYNQIHSGANADIAGVTAYISKNGAIVGFPDLVMQGGLLTGYSICTNYHNGNGTGGVNIPGPTMGAVQQAEWAGIAPGDVRSMQNLFDYNRGAIADDQGNKRLHGDMILWQWITAAQTGNNNQKFNSDATARIHALPTFGTYTA